MTHAALLLTLAMSLGARPVVVLAPEDRTHILGPVIQSLQAQLADLPVELKVEPVAKLEGSLGAQMRVARQVAGPDGLAVIWLELSPGDPIFVWVADPQRNRVLARSVDWDGALAHLEPVGLVVRSSVRALLDGEVIGFEAAPVPEQRATPRPQIVTEEPLFHLGASAAYVSSFLVANGLVLNGLDAMVFGEWADHLYVGVQYRAYEPFVVKTEDVSSESKTHLWKVSRHPISLAVGGGYTFGRVRIGAEVSGMLDVVEVLVGSDPTGWIGSVSPAHQLVFSLGAAAMLDVHIVWRLSAFATGGADFLVGRRELQLKFSTTPQTTSELGAIQPRFSLGLRFEFF